MKTLQNNHNLALTVLFVPSSLDSGTLHLGPGGNELPGEQPQNPVGRPQVHLRRDHVRSQHPAPCTLHPTPCTIHPEPYTLSLDTRNRYGGHVTDFFDRILVATYLDAYMKVPKKTQFQTW